MPGASRAGRVGERARFSIVNRTALIWHGEREEMDIHVDRRRRLSGLGPHSTLRRLRVLGEDYE
ncbi:MAG: hypothetical protein CL908_03170 [Deltaproteobacteria bacterium]|nr:hypothetical protein [Deltaproteobacteria bacterium]